MEGEDGESDNPRAFGCAAWWKRLIVLLAGAAMNFIFGLIILFVLYAPEKEVIVPEVAHVEQWCTIAGEDGIQVGDRFLEVDGEKIFVASDFSLLLQMNPAEKHDLVLLRDGEKVVLNDVPMVKKEVVDDNGNSSMLFGFSFSVVEADFPTKLSCVWNEARDIIRNVRLSLQMLFTGKAGLMDMSGPVGIVSIMSSTADQAETTQAAIRSMLYFGGFIAINLAVMNLLPIPALDGGRAVCLLLTTAAEKITRKKIDPKYEAYLHTVGMILLFGLMMILVFKDIFMIFKG